MRAPDGWTDIQVTGKLWIQKDDGEGMETDPDKIPEGATEEWMDEFWRREF